ncbi:MAG: C40 family peptidase [Bacteroidales bacterium]|nr:C40 family peptidase [Tenuifilaceae bacterium]
MFGIVNQSLASLRAEPFERSEMTSQLIFGETFSILEKHKEWIRVNVLHDNYEGWIDKKLCEVIDEEQMNLLTLEGASMLATCLFSTTKKGCEYPIKLCPGSVLYNFDKTLGTHSLVNETYKTYSTPCANENDSQVDILLDTLKPFMNAPYLWGGRSPYGVDCSGLVQVVYKIMGYKIPRDASQQVLYGNTIDFINLTAPGDLAFFDDIEGNIVHVGIILQGNKIVHSSGYVKIDLLDQQGIYSASEKRYTHTLRVIKRLLS